MPEETAPAEPNQLTHMDRLRIENERLKKAIKKMYHLAPRPWMPVTDKPYLTYEEWDEAMAEAEDLLGYVFHARESH